MVVVLKVLFVLGMIGVAFLIGWSAGVDTINIEYRDWKETDGWLVRPYKHLYCGAVYGHIYVKDTPEAGVRCKRCGKLYVPKTGKRKKVVSDGD